MTLKELMQKLETLDFQDAEIFVDAGEYCKVSSVFTAYDGEAVIFRITHATDEEE